MKTYQDNNYRYWYDTIYRMWTIIQVDAEGNQVGEANYVHRKDWLKKYYPQFKFTPYVEQPVNLNFNQTYKITV